MGKQTQAEARLADVYQSGDRSSLLLRHLAGRRPIWERQLSAMRAQLENLPGDAILAAGIATFLGALTLAEKKACLADWAKGCAEAGLSTSVGIGSSFGLRSWLRNVTPATSVVRQLTASPAGSETEPVGDDGMEKMTSAMYGHRPPLIVDPDEDFERLGGLATLGVAFQAGQTGQSAGSTGPGSHADVSSADVAGFRWKHVRAAAAGALQKAREALDNGAKVCLQIDGPSSDPWPDLMVAADVFAYVQELQKKAKAARKEQVPMNSDSAVPLDDVSRGLLPLAELRGPHDVILYTTHPNPGALPGYVTGLWNVLDFSVESPGGSAAENGIGNGKSAEDRMLGAVAEHVIPEVEARGRMLRASLETMRQVS